MRYIHIYMYKCIALLFDQTLVYSLLWYIKHAQQDSTLTTPWSDEQQFNFMYFHQYFSRQ